MNLVSKIKSKIVTGEERSVKAKKNILYSLVLKGLSILVSLVVVPMTINYVNPTQYGIWLTVSSIVGWLAFFDFGLGNGLRNKFTEAQALGNMRLAKEYVSTTYVVLSLIVFFLLIVSVIASFTINWSTLLNVDNSYQHELCYVFLSVSGFFCINMVSGLITTILTADQRPAMASWLAGLGQLLSLVVIFFLTKFTEGSLLNLALFYSGVPALVLLGSTFYFLKFTRYSEISPSIHCFKKKLIKEIFGLGIKFFVIYLCLLMIFQLSNIIISREISSIAVTQYNVVYKYFGIVYMLVIIIVNPYWSAFTDAYSKKEYVWMKKTIYNLEKVWLLTLPVLALMALSSNFVYKIWIGRDLQIDYQLSILMAIFVAVQSLSNIYMYMINGIGKIYLQTVAYVSFSILALPSLIYSCRNFGLQGALYFPIIVYLILAILSRLQLNKILNNTSSGFWNK